MFLTQFINEVPVGVIREYRSVFNVAWLRFSHLCNEWHTGDVLDDTYGEPDPTAISVEGKRGNETHLMRRPCEDGLFRVTRRFILFGSSYLGEIMRRFKYYDAISQTLQVGEQFTPATTASVKQWIVQRIYAIADQAFEELYQRLVEEAYSFPGDTLW
jgi:hypothetical protein